MILDIVAINYDFRYYGHNYDHVHVHDITILKLVDFLSSYRLLKLKLYGTYRSCLQLSYPEFYNGICCVQFK